MFFLHLWLPKAHVEAPTAGSIILAAILLKLRVYGVVRMFSFLKVVVSSSLLLIIIVGRVGGRVRCFLQRDRKRLIAYSRVAHINFGMFVLFLRRRKGVVFNYLLLFIHGVISRILFYFIGFLYQNAFTRAIYLLSGGATGIIFFIITLALIMNFGVPPFVRRVGEVIFFSLIYKILVSLVILLIIYGMFIRYRCLFIIIVFYQRRKKTLRKGFGGIKEVSSITVILMCGGNLLFLSLL